MGICTNNRRYKKNALKKRIARVMRFTNGVSMVLVLVAMTFIIGSLIAFLGKGFTMYAANEIATKVEDSYIELKDRQMMDEMMPMDKGNFETETSVDEDNALDEGGIYEKLSEEERQKMEEIWDGFVELKGIQRFGNHQRAFEDVTYFEYQIHFRNKIVYDSYDDNQGKAVMDQYVKNNLVMEKFFTESAAPLFNEKDEVIGKVVVHISPDILHFMLLAVVGLFIVIFCANAIINKIITMITARMVSKPLETLAKQMEDMAKEDLESAFDVELSVKRPVSEVKSLASSTMMIMQKMAHYYELMTAQNEELEAQRDELESQRDEMEAQRDELEAQRNELESHKYELEAQNDQLVRTGQTLTSMNDAYLGRTLKLQNLLDNVGQGFLTFGTDLAINPEYSYACTSMIASCHICGDSHAKVELSGQKITDLLFANDEQKDFIEKLLNKILTGDERERNLFIPLLPEEIEQQGKIQKVEYKVVRDEKNNEQMMIILTDITHTRYLENQMAAEKEILQMIVKVLMNRDEVITIIEEFNEFVLEDRSLLTQNSYEDILRRLHTYKGTFSQFYMNTIAEHLNELEDTIYKDGSIDSIRAIDAELVIEKLEKDMAIIENYVGVDFLDVDDTYTVKEEKIIDMEQKIKGLLPASDYNRILPIIRSLRYKSIKEGLKTYPDYVRSLGERLGKSIVPFEIEGDDVFVDYDHYHQVFKSIVHLFRNAVDHGIEDPDTRIELNKAFDAVVKCHIVDRGDSVDIVVSDDGSGMEVETINRIFDIGFSTKDEATPISGRGVGLPALKDEVEKLGGSIVVKSQVGEGTEFIVRLPIIKGTEIVHFEPSEFIEQVDTTTTELLSQMSFDIGKGTFEPRNQVVLHRVSALLSMKGSIDGIMIVSVNDAFGKSLVERFVIDKLNDDEIAEYMEDVLGETTNTILGNLLGNLEEKGVYLSIGIPATLTNKSAYIKYSDKQIYTVHYEKDGYVVSINLLITENPNVGEFIIEKIEGEL